MRFVGAREGIMLYLYSAVLFGVLAANGLVILLPSHQPLAIEGTTTCLRPEFDCWTRLTFAETRALLIKLRLVYSGDNLRRRFASELDALRDNPRQI
jgi:hypothetical protein